VATVDNPDPLGIGIFVIFALYGLIFVGSLAMLVIALVDIVKRPEWQWKIAGQEKVLWILLVVLVNVIAIPSLIYWFNIRKKLMAVETAAASGQFGPGHITYAGWEPGPAPMAPPGWHPDPSGQYRFRWWDGTRWSEHTWNDGAAAP
jgi:Protein of unknown function (DUF2510)